MIFRFTRDAVVALLLAGPALAAHAQEHIPDLHGTTFTGQQLTLPEGLKGHTAILIMGFSEGSRVQSAAWGKRLAADPARPAGLDYYELAMVEGVPRLLRGLVLKKIKESVSANGQAHFVPVEEHEADWKRIARFDKPDDAYLLVVDQTGAVRYRSEGALTDAAYETVIRVAAGLGQPASGQ